MAKKRQFTQDDMDRINELIAENKQQSAQLDQILLCLKGSASMNIEGIIPAQKRIENEIKVQKKEIEEAIDQKFDSIKTTLDELVAWKQIVSIYMGLIMSKKVWRGIAIFVGIVMIIILSIKYGFQNVWHYIKGWFL